MTHDGAAAAQLVVLAVGLVLVAELGIGFALLVLGQRIREEDAARERRLNDELERRWNDPEGPWRRGS